MERYFPHLIESLRGRQSSLVSRTYEYLRVHVPEFVIGHLSQMRKSYNKFNARNIRQLSDRRIIQSVNANIMWLRRYFMTLIVIIFLFIPVRIFLLNPLTRNNFLPVIIQVMCELGSVYFAIPYIVEFAHWHLFRIIQDGNHARNCSNWDYMAMLVKQAYEGYGAVVYVKLKSPKNSQESRYNNVPANVREIKRADVTRRAIQFIAMDLNCASRTAIKLVKTVQGSGLIFVITHCGDSDEKMIEVAENLQALNRMLRSSMDKFNLENSLNFEMQWGSSIGYVVLAELGAFKRKIDVFCDTANCSARMAGLFEKDESLSKSKSLVTFPNKELEDKILPQVSGLVEFVGNYQVKGKGDMNVYSIL